MNYFLFALINREYSLVATENYNHPFIAIEKMIFPSLPFIYVFLSLGCHSVKFHGHDVNQSHILPSPVNRRQRHTASLRRISGPGKSTPAAQRELAP